MPDDRYGALYRPSWGVPLELLICKSTHAVSVAGKMVSCSAQDLRIQLRHVAYDMPCMVACPLRWPGVAKEPLV